MLLASCGEKKQEPIVTPWGEVLDSVEVTEGFDLHEIQQGGELILATISGPQTYYDYHGKSLGIQYLLVQKLADKLGVKVRVEVCRDSLELVKQPETRTIDLTIVAHITQRHHCCGIALRIDITQIVDGRVAGREVEVVEGGLVRAHIPLIQQIHTHDLALDGLASCINILHRHHHHIVATSGKHQQGPYVKQDSFHISTLKVRA